MAAIVGVRPTTGLLPRSSDEVMLTANGSPLAAALTPA
jgi:hypothetical protein